MVICHDLHRGGRTISKEWTIFKTGIIIGFRIVEEYVVDCLEIGSHNKRWLWKRHDFSVKSDTGKCYTNKLTESNPLYWIVGPYWLSQPCWILEEFESLFLKGIHKAIIIMKRYGFFWTHCYWEFFKISMQKTGVRRSRNIAYRRSRFVVYESRYLVDSINQTDFSQGYYDLSSGETSPNKMRRHRR